MMSAGKRSLFAHRVHDADNLFLVGFMGTGKSAVATELSRHLGWKAVDTDEQIEAYANRSIPDIFREFGEAHFRQLETEVLTEVARDHQQVVATGGGAVLAEHNRKTMLASGYVIALIADPETIIRRVSTDTNRPLLQGDVRKKVYEMMKRREGVYEFAPFTIDTSDLSVAEVVKKILQQIDRLP